MEYPRGGKYGLGHKICKYYGGLTFMLQVSDSLSDPAPAMAAEERKTKRGVRYEHCTY